MHKVLALFRFIYHKVLTSGLSIPQMSYIGRATVLKCIGGGSIDCAGKIRMDSYSELMSLGKLSVGNSFVINSYSRIIAHDKIEIGDNVLIARFVSVLDHDHANEGNENRFKGYNTAPIKIGHNVWLGDKVTILKGVSIGNNVTVAANSVVTKDVPDNVIVGGVPAKVLKEINAK